MARPIWIFIASLTPLAIGACAGAGTDRTVDPPTASTTAADDSTTSDPEDETSLTSTSLAETDEASVEQALQELADRYDGTVAQILEDPRVAGDPAHPAVRDYLDLFVPGSEFAAGALAAWAQQGADGRFYRPGPRGRMSESTVVDVAFDEGTRTVTFVLCSILSLEIVDAAGRPVSGEGGQTAASAVAEMVRGEWLLRELSETSPDGCGPSDGGSA